MVGRFNPIFPKKFQLDLNDYLIWNYDDFIKFLTDNQNDHIELTTNEEGVSLAGLGVYKLLDYFTFASVTVRTANIVETHDRYNIVVTDKAYRFFDLPTVDYTEYHTWNQSKVFGALYNRATWPRMALSGHLYANYKDQTLLNFRYDPHDENTRKLFEMQELFDLDIQSAQDFINACTAFPLQVESADGFTPGVSTQTHTDQLASFYPNFLIDIVAETFVTGRTFFPTEKTLRPMLLKKPFILMGPKCYLIHLRQMGFRTFHDFWNEDYDGFGPKIRYFEILKLLDNLSKKSTTELEKLYKDMQGVLDHNYQVLTDKTFKKEIEYVN